METVNKKKNDTQPRMSLWQQYYPLVIVIVILVILFSYNAVLQYISIDDLSIVFYPLLRWGHILNALIFYLLFPTIFLFLITKIVKRNLPKYRNRITIQSDLIALILLIFVGVSPCGYIVGSLITSDTYRHRDSLQVNDNIYMLTQHILFNAYLGDGVLLLYQCDSMGLFCTEILARRNLFGRIDLAELAFNEVTQGLTIIVNDERFTYQLE